MTLQKAYSIVLDLQQQIAGALVGNVSRTKIEHMRNLLIKSKAARIVNSSL